MNVYDIIVKYLKNNGYDGLCNENCGCPINDLMPCDESLADCEPGHKKQCDCGDWFIANDESMRNCVDCREYYGQCKL